MQRTFYIKSETEYQKWKDKAKRRSMSISAYLQMLVDNDNAEAGTLKGLFLKQK